MTDPHTEGPPLFDPRLLDEEDQALFESITGSPISGPVPASVSDLYSLGHIFMLEGGGVPDAVLARIAELDPEQHVGQYQDTVRRARHDNHEPT